MRRIIDGFFSTLGLISRIPLGRHARADFSLVGVFIPVVGLIVASIDIGLYALSSRVLRDPALTAIILITVQYLLFNLFHFDGFVDTMDAVFVGGGAEGRRRVLKDVHAGSFGLFFAVIYLAAKLHLLSRGLSSSPADEPAAWVLLSFPLSGRIAAVLLAAFLRPAKPGGLAAAMGRPSAATVALGTVLGLSPFVALCLAGLLPAPLLGCFAAALIGFAAAALIYRYRFGGATGDGLGFAVETAELAHLALFFALSAQAAQAA